jgi:hypothetical protein
MPGRGRRSAIAIAAVMGGLVVTAASASAYTVTIHVHGAGTVSEVTNRTGGSRGLGSCTVGPSAKSNASSTDCVLGTESGLWNFGDIVRLGESVDTTASSRGWVYDHWTDSSASGFVNCDPQDTTGDFSSPSYCEFQIFQDLQVDLWFKDTTGPNDTAISGGPTQGSTTSSTTATFTSFSAASDPDATFQCRLDPPGSIGSWATCPANRSFSGLTQNGTWQLNVRGVDPSGNVDTTPASRSWVVDTTPPVVNLTGGPGAGSTTKQTSATFNVSTSDGSLVCTLDGATLSSCSPPTVTLSSLGNGSHTFTVRGVDAVGNSSSPISRQWTVDTVPPTLTLSGGPPEGSTTTDHSATFTIGTSEGTLACTLDGAPVACSAPSITLTSLADGTHTFAISASDAVGNGATQSRSWTVGTTSSSGGSSGAGSTTTATPPAPVPPTLKKCKKGRKLRHGRCVKKKHH